MKYYRFFFYGTSSESSVRFTAIAYLSWDLSWPIPQLSREAAILGNAGFDTWQLLQLCSQPKPPSCILCGVGVAQSYPARCDPMDRTPPGSSVHGIPQARILEWVAMPFSRGSSRPRNRTPGLRHYRETFYHLSHQGSSCTLYPMTLIYSLML